MCLWEALSEKAAHNGKYIIQVLYDSLEDIGGDTPGMVRP
jgi:hypothetical protein